VHGSTSRLHLARDIDADEIARAKLRVDGGRRRRRPAFRAIDAGLTGIA
jgi:hypothetical protein